MADQRARRRRVKQRSGFKFWARLGVRLALAMCLASVLLVVPFAWLPPPTSSFMLRYHSDDPAAPYYEWVPLQAISPQLALAVVAAEDQRFPHHNGFDWHGIQVALANYRAGKPLRGASTISQQLVKNLYLWPGRSVLRKALEAWLTLLVELSWSKRRILEVYLNVVQFGDGVFGAQAGSRHFFKVPASALTPEQAALLAAVLPAPALYHVAAPSDHMRRRQAWILQQMRQLGGPAYLAQLTS